MDIKQFARRSWVLLAVLTAIMLAFTSVLYDLQVVNGWQFREQSTRKIANTETVQAARGEILDRYGRVLVSNRRGHQVTLSVASMGEVPARNANLLKLLSVCREQEAQWDDPLPVSAAPPYRYTVEEPYGTPDEPSQLQRLVTKLKLKDFPADPSAGQLVTALRTYFEVDEAVGEREGRDLVGVLYALTLRTQDVARTDYVFIKDDVDIAFITAIKEANLAGVRIDTVSVRQYETPYAAHLLGSVGSIQNWDDYKDKGYSLNDTVGIDGAEQAFEDLLRGTPGVRDVELNQRGKVVSGHWQVDPETGEERAPQPGNNVMLTLDIRLQQVVEEALARHVPGMTEETEGAACVVTDMTGGVLAMASYPTFDLANYRRNWTQLSQDPLHPLLNRALQGLYAPGSTIKMAVAAGALSEGVITRTEKIQDTGRYLHYDRREDQPQCWIYRQYGSTHGWENVSEAIRDSCNVFFYETGLRLGIEKLDEYAAKFGLGETTGLELYEAKGEMAGPETSARHGQIWYEGDTMYAAIGQGNTQLTPIQLANYIATLVNGGSHYPTHLLKTVKSNDYSQVVEEYEPEERDHIDLSREDLEAVKRGMGMAASDGSVAGYFAGLPVKLGAKTGTAQVSRNSEAHALLVAFAPYEDPEVAISIVVEHGGSGTAVAELAAEILDYYFASQRVMDAPAAEEQLIR